MSFVVRCVAVYAFFFSSRRRHTRCALVTGVQTCALPIFAAEDADFFGARPQNADRAARLAGVHHMLGCGGDDPAARGVVDRAGAEIPAVEVAGDDHGARGGVAPRHFGDDIARLFRAEVRSEEHTSELQSLMRISYA